MQKPELLRIKSYLDAIVEERRRLENLRGGKESDQLGQLAKIFGGMVLESEFYLGVSRLS